jgi:penicillin-binding protein 1A
MLYAYSHYFNSDDEFTLSSDEYKMNSDGSMTIYAGKRLNIYNVEVNGEKSVSIEFKGMYTQESGKFYFIESGALSIPTGYTTTDDDGNAVVSAQFFTDYPNFFVSGSKGLTVTSSNYSLKQKVRQPQGATVVIENETGEIKAMMGGRGAKGKKLYNRATSPRQPGSSIKPIGVYGPALQMSAEYASSNKKMNLDTSDGSDYGDYITAGSVINDKPIKYNGKNWPKNWYSGYKGQVKLRYAVEQSINTCAVKVFQQIGTNYSISMLKKVGVTSIDEEGDTNDLNPAALALGGMTNGISPLELAAAYAVFPNGGIYKEPVSYTKVLNSGDEVLFQKETTEEQVYDEGVAWIMTDILRTVVTNGLGSSAAIGSQPVGGKTGTTTSNYDLWFCGFTPQYTAAVWMGNDVNMQLSGGSSQSARLWAKIMKQVCADLPRGSFKSKPSNVVSQNGEYYISGTYSKTSMTSTADSTEEVTIIVEETVETVTQATTEATTHQQTTHTATTATRATSTRTPANN